MKLKDKYTYGVKGYPAETIATIHADFLALGSLSAVARKYDRSCSNIRQILQRRGLYTPKAGVSPGAQRDPLTSQFVGQPRLTEEEIDHLVEGMTRFRLPSALRWQWREWPMERRAALIARLRVKFRNPQRDRPTTPFSANVEPFDYTTPRAWEIANAANEGLPSRLWKVRLFPNSWGVIWQGRLWFWVPYNDSKGHNGSYQAGRYEPGFGRPQLHSSIWAQAHGRPFPPQHVLRFIDGNPNNLLPENLILETRDKLCRENQSTALRRQSIERTGLLLKRSQQRNEEQNGKANLVQQLVGQVRPARPKGRGARPGKKTAR